MARKARTRTTFSSTIFSPPKSSFVVISMASLFLLSIISALTFFTLSSASHHHHHHPSISPPHFTPTPPTPPQPSAVSVRPEIQRACKATRFPDQCESSLSESNVTARTANVIDIIQSATRVSLENLETAQSMVKDILDASVGNLNRTTAARNCQEVLRNSNYRILSTIDRLPSNRIKDCRAWMSAALLFQYDCWSALKYANDTQMVDKTMSFLNSLTELSSNALSMIIAYDVLGSETGSWGPPKTERDGFWEGVGSGSSGSANLGFAVKFPSGLTVDAIVCTSGSDGCFKTVQEAVNAAPDNKATQKFVIQIKEGVYEETVRVPLEKKNVVFLGDGMGKTVITGSLNVGQPGISTYNSATVGVAGDGFMASGLTIQNTAGPDAHQAVAFRSDSDLSIIENVEFLGNQDTLYAHALRQFYKSCRIEGNVDFIFGNSASFFQNCTILVRPRQIKPEKGENNAITAHGRTDPAQSTGFVFQNCLINGTEDYMQLYYSRPQVHKNFLGRPWKEYSRTVFLHCTLEALITPQGWMPWSGDFALETLFYGEFENFGPGLDVSKRVSWSNQISADHVFAYSIENFIQGDEWILESQKDRQQGRVKKNRKTRIGESRSVFPKS